MFGRAQDETYEPDESARQASRTIPTIEQPAEGFQRPRSAQPWWAWATPVVVISIVAAWAAATTPYQASGPPIRSDGSGYYAWTRAIVTGDLSFCGNEELVTVVAISAGDWARVPGRAPSRSCAARLGLACCTTRPTTARLHGSSALLVAALCWVGIRAARQGRPPPVAATVAITALLTLTRNTNVLVIGSLAVGWLVWQRCWAGHVGAMVRACLPAGIGVALGLAMQLTYNRHATGTWTLSSYGAEPFLLDRPRQAAVIASYERGLLTWYPVLAVGFVALLLTGTGRRLSALVLLVVGPLVMLYGFWHSWALGGGFGHRGFVEVVPVVLIAFAIGLQQLPPAPRRLLASGMVVATLATVSLMAGYWRGSIHFGGTGEQAYWSHVIGEDSLYRP